MDTKKIIARIDEAIETLESIKRTIAGPAAEFPKQRLSLIENRICLSCELKIPAEEKVFRGCHERCYRQISRKIEKGQITDTEAILAGSLAPPEPPGRKDKSNIVANIKAKAHDAIKKNRKPKAN